MFNIINSFLDNLDSYQEVGANALGVEHNFSIGGISMMQAVLGVATLGIGILISVVVYKVWQVREVAHSQFSHVQFHFDCAPGTDTRYYPVDIVQFDDNPIFSSFDNWIGRFNRINGGTCAQSH